MELRQPGTIPHQPEVMIESDGMQMNETQDHHEANMDRNEPQEGGTEVQMERVDPVSGPPEEVVV